MVIVLPQHCKPWLHEIGSDDMQQWGVLLLDAAFNLVIYITYMLLHLWFQASYSSQLGMSAIGPDLRLHLVVCTAFQTVVPVTLLLYAFKTSRRFDSRYTRTLSRQSASYSSSNARRFSGANISQTATCKCCSYMQYR